LKELTTAIIKGSTGASQDGKIERRGVRKQLWNQKKILRSERPAEKRKIG